MLYWPLTATAAYPTTFGKEIAVFVHRLTRLLADVDAVRLSGKFSGATGTFSAHVVAAPDVDWIRVSREFVESVGLTSWNPLTAQIESHDAQAALLARISRRQPGITQPLHRRVDLHFARVPYSKPGCWARQVHQRCPTKLIRFVFENAEANLEIASALGDALGATLVTSRLQRDLTDSTTQTKPWSRARSLALGRVQHHRWLRRNHCRSPTRFSRTLRRERCQVLGEAIQTVLRAERAAGTTTIETYDY